MASLAVFGILATCLTAADASGTSTPPQISPTDLISAYRTNRAFFDENYASKAVEVTGRVEKVSATGGPPAATPVSYGATGSAWTCTCAVPSIPLQYQVRMFADKSVIEFTFGEEARSQLAKLKLPQEVTIQGTCLGAEERRDGFRIYFTGCKVVKFAATKSERPCPNGCSVLGAVTGALIGGETGSACSEPKADLELQVAKLQLRLKKLEKRLSEVEKKSKKDAAASGPLYQGKPASYWLKQLKDKAPAYRVEALKALGEIAKEDRTLIPAILPALCDQNCDVQAQACQSFCSDEIPELTEALQDPKLRCTAILACSGILAHNCNSNVDVASVVPSLIPILEDKESLEWYLAAQTIGEIGPEAKEPIPALVKLLSDENGRPAYSFRYRLPPSAPAKAVPAQAAAIALGEIGQNAKVAIPALKQLLQSENEAIREAAAAALKKIDPGAETYLPK